MRRRPHTSTDLVRGRFAKCLTSRCAPDRRLNAPGDSGTRFWPKHRLTVQPRCRASVRSGSLPRSPVRWSVVVTTQRPQRLATRNGDLADRDARPAVLGPGGGARDDQVRPETVHRQRPFLRAVARGDQRVESVERRGRGDQQRIAVGETDGLAGLCVLRVDGPPARRVVQMHQAHVGAEEALNQAWAASPAGTTSILSRRAARLRCQPGPVRGPSAVRGRARRSVFRRRASAPHRPTRDVAPRVG